MKFYIEDWKGNAKRINQLEATLIVGADRFKEVLSSAKAAHTADPHTLVEYMVSSGRLTIEF
jgi:hypothetical protein